MRDNNDKKKVFLMSGFSNFLEKDTLDMKIRRLGGICRLMETMYISEATHVIVPNSWNEQWTPVVMGAVGSGTYVVLEKYIHDSFIQNRFVEESTYMPSQIELLRQAYMKYGKLFINQTVVVLLKDFKKQMELKSMVRDSGGNILNWTCKDLGLKRDEDLLKINVIYTDLSDDVLEDLNFKKFIKKRESLGNAVIVRSYYCIFKLCKYNYNMLYLYFGFLGYKHQNITNSSQNTFN